MPQPENKSVPLQRRHVEDSEQTSTEHFATASANFSIGLTRPLIVGILGWLNCERMRDCFRLHDRPEAAAVVVEKDGKDDADDVDRTLPTTDWSTRPSAPSPLTFVAIANTELLTECLTTLQYFIDCIATVNILALICKLSREAVTRDLSHPSAMTNRSHRLNASKEAP
jgi:hypothetical protein